MWPYFACRVRSGLLAPPIPAAISWRIEPVSIGEALADPRHIEAFKQAVLWLGEHAVLGVAEH